VSAAEIDDEGIRALATAVLKKHPSTNGTAASATDPSAYKLSRDLFSYEPYGLVVRRNDADFRLVANRALAQIYRADQIEQIYAQWFGKAGLRPSPMLTAVYTLGALPE